MKLKNILLASMFAALICVVTSFAKVPLPVAGYVHLGDVFVFVAAAFLPLPYAVAACAVGGFFADIVAGFVNYAFVTALAKAAMAIIARLLFAKNNRWLDVLAVVCSAVAMTFAYWLFEVFVYDIAVATANVPFNLLQAGLCGLVAAPVCVATKKALAKRNG